MYVAIPCDEVSQEHQRAFDALDQGKLLMVRRHDLADVDAAAKALTIPEKWGRTQHQGKGAPPFLAELSHPFLIFPGPYRTDRAHSIVLFFPGCASTPWQASSTAGDGRHRPREARLPWP
jgi:hypothetical protein